jgi:hypothetical protein
MQQPRLLLALLAFLGAGLLSPAARAGSLKAGLATRDITPGGPIWLSGYSARNKPSERADHPLKAQALALEGDGSERVIILSLDNCEVSREFAAPVLEEIARRAAVAAEAIYIVSSHTHSAPCLEHVLVGMFHFEGEDGKRIAEYSARLRQELVEVAVAAVADLKPAVLAYGKGRARFAMNRRIYGPDRIDFGENPDGPVDEDVHVLRVTGPAGEPRAILFGYACHGTTITGDDFYVVSGDYMAYAREQIEAAFPGMTAMYLTGCGADANPSPRGRLIHARQNGLELAGAVAGVLNQPLRTVEGPLRRAFRRIDLPLAASPDRARLEADAQSKDRHVANRARLWLSYLNEGKELPRSVSYPMAALRIGDDLTMILFAGEVVADYSLRLKRELAADMPWSIGYAMEVPCYIPTVRILKEGGYEADSSLIYYGIYGPLLGRTEGLILETVRDMVKELRS